MKRKMRSSFINRNRKLRGYLLAIGGIFIAIILLIASCDDNPNDNGLTKTEKQLNELREATAAFEDVNNAEAAGWDTFFPPYCMDHKNLGAMGVHRLNPDLVDDEIILNKPELLVYEVQVDGSLRFVAVEYIVPFSERPANATPPNLFGYEFGPNNFFKLWGLHAWLADNPNGTFKNWNPQITCAYADSTLVFPQPDLKMHH